ncbi:leucine-rich repeat-containing protein 74B-like isoform X1 [Octopus vulgaris]|uniref:Leucine-rich repeat-containing protein 74B-like isoform X1 n=1 Tax=Octopus vulgaris TaxID=6645 RepID=A0AA36AGB0_OCTVU|nr:leucine-rich repeat-containing protein 74B-like isoform X1 [Octopus vulgaris]
MIFPGNIRLNCILRDPNYIYNIPKATKLSEIEQEKILALKAEGVSNQKIAEKIRRSRTPADNFLKDPDGYKRPLSRIGVRKTRLANLTSEQSMSSKKPGESESESGSDHVKELTSESDVLGLDIFDDALWDTDLNSEIKPPYDHSGRSAYITRCKRLGATPISYFLRHMEDNKLDLRYHGLGGKGTSAVTPTLATSCHVQKLDLTDNNLNRSGGLALCEMIKENCFISELNARKLEYLDISHNNLENKSGKIIGPALPESSSLKHLNMSWNNIRSNGLEAIGTGLKNNDTLTYFDVSWNGIDKNAAKTIGEALKSNSTLEHLDMSNCRINAESSVLIAFGIGSNSSLKVLKMIRNPMEGSGCYAICAAVLRNQNSVIEHLNFQHTHVDKDFEDLLNKVKEKLPDIKVIYGCQEAPKKPKAVIHPMARLVRYLDDNNIRLADCFGTFDEDGSMTVTHEEFIKGIESIGLKLDDAQKVFLLNEMDRDGDGEIDYSELVRSRMEFKAKANSAEYLFPKMHVQSDP